MNSTVKNEKIVIVGYGWVGQANALALARMGYDVYFFDVASPKYHYSDTAFSLYERIKPLTKPLEIDGPNTWYIVCVGDRVSEEGVQDISLITGALATVREAKGKVILRSTVLPQHLTTLHFDFYYPEFLHEQYAIEECLHPFLFVLGTTDKTLALPTFLQSWREQAEKEFIGTPSQASYIKYLSNIWNALRIAFVNEFGDCIATPDTEENQQEIEHIIDFFFEKRSYVRYGKGFGGHCLPKDLRAFNAMHGKNRSIPLLRGTYESNTLHEQLVAAYKTVPQWLSSWEYTSQPLRTIWVKFNTLPSVRSVRKFLQPLLFKFETFFPAITLKDIEQRWNSFAQRNPYYYTHPDTKGGPKADEFEVKDTGQKDYALYIEQDTAVQMATVEKSNQNVVEIGSGIGRMTEQFVRHFRNVIAVDISDTMLDMARKRLSAANNVQFIKNKGNDIPLANESADLIFSYDTFKYIPSRVLIQEYLNEIYRVLRPGGTAKIQLRTGAPIHRWKWYYGISISPEEARQLVKINSYRSVNVQQDGSKYLWLTLTK